jgi:hypothetical protein
MLECRVLCCAALLLTLQALSLALCRLRWMRWSHGTPPMRRSRCGGCLTAPFSPAGGALVPGSCMASLHPFPAAELLERVSVQWAWARLRQWARPGKVGLPDWSPSPSPGASRLQMQLAQLPG